MHISDFDYELPDELIARYPGATRSGSRLLCLDKRTGQVGHRVFRDILDLVAPGDLLVFNDTRVLPARLFGRKATGGRVEVLIERVLSDREALAQVRASKAPPIGTLLEIERAVAPGAEVAEGGAGTSAPTTETLQATVLGREDQFFHLRFAGDEPLVQLLERFGHIPLPPYIDRADELSDQTRYQTVYGKQLGAVAAPTAGLHFDEPLLAALAERGIATAFLTLHVGSGTFQPVRVENIAEHKMHSEWVDVPASVCAQVNACKARGGRVIAVGTTSVRSLESAARHSLQDRDPGRRDVNNVTPRLSPSPQPSSPQPSAPQPFASQTESGLQPFSGDTDIFIRPGYSFQVVDAMITNFHLPRSTLMMLISAFAGREAVMGAYQEAVRQRYRFFSYGDAMFIF